MGSISVYGLYVCQDCVCLYVLVFVVYAFIVFSNVVKCCLDSIGCIP